MKVLMAIFVGLLLGWNLIILWWNDWLTNLWIPYAQAIHYPGCVIPGDAFACCTAAPHALHGYTLRTLHPAVHPPLQAVTDRSYPSCAWLIVRIHQLSILVSHKELWGFVCESSNICTHGWCLKVLLNKLGFIESQSLMELILVNVMIPGYLKSKSDVSKYLDNKEGEK